MSWANRAYFYALEEAYLLNNPGLCGTIAYGIRNNLITHWGIKGTYYGVQNASVDVITRYCVTKHYKYGHVAVRVGNIILDPVVSRTAVNISLYDLLVWIR